MTMRITASVDPKQAQEIVDVEFLRLETAVSGAVETATDGLKLDYREQVKSAGLGQRLANTWRSEIFPEGEPSAKAAGFVWNKAPHIVAGFAFGATIRPTNKRFLAIPTDNAPARAPDGSRMSPSNFPGRRDLIPITSRSGTRYLAVRRGRRLVPMFILVPSVQIRRRLDIDAPARKRHAQLEREILKNLGRSS